MMNRSLNSKHGFSLIELITAIGISGIVLGAITATFISQSRSYDAQEQINGMQQAARAAMDMITREARMAGYNTNGAAVFDGITYNATQIRVQANLDGDTDTGDANEDITYSYDAVDDVIERTTGGTTDTLVENIDVFTFQYLDESGTATTTSADIRQIQITITARTARSDPSYTANGGYRTYTLTSLITPRNLAY
jgi:type IV pilus assembly protein PilW